MSDTSGKIAFLIFDQRSGSTILARKITEKLNGVVVPDCHFLIKILIRFNHNQKIDGLTRIEIKNIFESDRTISDWGINEDIIREITDTDNIYIYDFIKRIIYLLRKRYKLDPDEYLILKKESYIFLKHVILDIFPKLLFIGITRDPRAVFVSKKNSLYTGTGAPFTRSSIRAAFDWRLYRERCKKLVSEQITFIEVSYEDLILKPDTELVKIANVIGVRNQNNNREFKLPSRYEKIHKNVMKEMDVSKIEKWKNEISLLEKIFIEILCVEEILDSGYKPHFLKIQILYPLIFMLSNSLYMFCILIFRMRSNLRWTKDLITLEKFNDINI